MAMNKGCAIQAVLPRGQLPNGALEDTDAGTGERAQQLTPASLPGNQGLVSNTHIGRLTATYNPNFREPNALFWPLQVTTCMYLPYPYPPWEAKLMLIFVSWPGP